MTDRQIAIYDNKLNKYDKISTPVPVSIHLVASYFWSVPRRAWQHASSLLQNRLRNRTFPFDEWLWMTFVRVDEAHGRAPFESSSNTFRTFPVASTGEKRRDINNWHQDPRGRTYGRTFRNCGYTDRIKDIRMESFTRHSFFIHYSPRRRGADELRSISSVPRRFSSTRRPPPVLLRLFMDFSLKFAIFLDARLLRDSFRVTVLLFSRWFRYFRIILRIFRIFRRTARSRYLHA